MAIYNARSKVKFDFMISVELYPQKKPVVCEAYFNNAGQVVALDIFLQGPFEGRKYTLSSTEDELAVLARARSLHNSGHSKPINKEIDTNTDNITATIRQKDLITSRSFVRTDKPGNKELPETEVIEQSESSAIESKKITKHKPQPNVNRIYDLLMNNNNNKLTTKDICEKLNISDSSVTDCLNKLKVIRTVDPAYRGKGRRFLLSLSGVNKDYQPHDMDNK